MTRRKMLATTLTAALAGIVCGTPGLMRVAHAEDAEDRGTKTLIVYFSRSGNTRAMAEHIQSVVGGDLAELKTITPYPEDYDTLTKQAKEELQSGYLPPLQTKIDNIGSYHVVFVGSPSWWATLAPPMRTFLATHDLSGKTIVPFVTHEGSGMARSAEDLASFCPKSTVLKGLALRGRRVTDSRKEVLQWLREIGLAAE